ncbi:hypothetical protein D3C83_108580 [compost metagenome]
MVAAATSNAATAHFPNGVDNVNFAETGHAGFDADQDRGSSGQRVEFAGLSRAVAPNAAGAL